jgi:hypothetical protein
MQWSERHMNNLRDSLRDVRNARDPGANPPMRARTRAVSA